MLDSAGEGCAEQKDGNETNTNLHYSPPNTADEEITWIVHTVLKNSYDKAILYLNRDMKKVFLFASGQLRMVFFSLSVS